MVAPLFLNNVSSVIQAGSTAIGSATAQGINVPTGEGAKWGSVGTNQRIYAVVVDTSTSPETVKEFVAIAVGGISGDTLTVVRQAEESSRYPASTTTIQSGYTIAAVATATGLTNISQQALPSGITGQGKYSDNLNLYVPPGVRPWRTRGKLDLSAAGSSRAKIAVVGASNVGGYNGSTSLRGGKGTAPGADYPYLLIKTLQAAGYPVSDMPVVINDFTTVDTRATTGGTWTHSTQPSAAVYATIPSGGTLTWTCDRPADNFYIDCAGTGAAFTVKIDGAFPASGNVTVVNGTYTAGSGTVTPDGGSHHTTVTITSQTKAPHTYLLTASAAGCVIYMVDAYLSNAVSVANFGSSSSQTNYYDDTSAFNTLLNNVLAWSPDTVILDGGLAVNDNNNSIALSTTQTNLESMITTLQAASIEVILVTPPPPTGLSPTFTPLPQTFQQMFYTVADAKGVWLIDNIDRQVSRANSNSLGLLGSDSFHPNAAGYQDNAKSLAHALGLPVLPAWMPQTVLVTTGSTYTIPDTVTQGGTLIATFGASTTFTFPTAISGGRFTMLAIQDATGSRVPTWPSSSILDWLTAGAPTLTTTASKIDTLTFFSDGAKWYGYLTGLAG